MGVTKFAQVNVFSSSTLAITFLHSAMACSTAGFMCSGFIWEKFGKAEPVNNGLLIMVYSLINDDVDVRPLLNIFKACHIFVFDLFIFVKKGTSKSLT